MSELNKLKRGFLLNRHFLDLRVISIVEERQATVNISHATSSNISLDQETPGLRRPLFLATDSNPTEESLSYFSHRNMGIGCSSICRTSARKAAA